MRVFKDLLQREIRLTYERYEHLVTDHPEMVGQIERVGETLLNPDQIVRSRTDEQVELFYKHYKITPVTEKFLCAVVKVLENDAFVITVYFTDAIKKGEILWPKK